MTPSSTCTATNASQISSGQEKRRGEFCNARTADMVTSHRQRKRQQIGAGSDLDGRQKVAVWRTNVAAARVLPNPSRGPILSRWLVVLLVHSATEEPSAQRTEPSEHVIHVAEIHQLDQVPIEVPGKEKRMAARRSFGTAHEF